MLERGDDKKTMRETLEVAVKRGSKRAMAELENQEEFPAVMSDPWDWYTRLRETSGSAMGEGPITEVEMAAFFSNRGLRPRRWQVEAIVMLDRLSRGGYKPEDDGGN